MAINHKTGFSISVMLKTKKNICISFSFFCPINCLSMSLSKYEFNYNAQVFITASYTSKINKKSKYKYYNL